MNLLDCRIDIDTLTLGNCSMRRLKRLLLVPYFLHPCSRGPLPQVGEGMLL